MAAERRGQRRSPARRLEGSVMNEPRKTVLHVDDKVLWREYVKNLLSDQYHVVSCGDCQSAFGKIQQGGVDMVILDHFLPGSGPFTLGLDFCAHLRKVHPRLPVIVYTGAWQGVEEVNRKDLQSKCDAIIVFKDGRDAALDNLRAMVDEHFSEPLGSD
jgi:CheY-like chemotaxis protein